MINRPDKTIPYRLSPAELENLRLLRKRMNPAGSIQQDEEQEKMREETDARNSNPNRLNQNYPKKKGNRT